MEGGLKFINSAPWTLTTLLLGYFAIHQMEIAMIYRTKFEVSIFTRSKFTEGVLKLKNGPWTLTTPLLRVFCHA